MSKKNNEDKEPEVVAPEVEELPFLTLHTIELMKDIKTKAITPPNWGGRIMIQGLTLAQYTMCQDATKELQAGMALAFAMIDPVSMQPMVQANGEAALAGILKTKSVESMEYCFLEIIGLSEGIKKPSKDNPKS